MPNGSGTGPYRGVDINILPEWMRRPRLELTAPAAGSLGPTYWLLAILAGLLLVPFYQFAGRAQADLEQKQVAQRVIDAEIQRRKSLPGELDSLRATLTQTLQLSSALELDYQNLVVGQVYWAEILDSIKRASPAGVEITDIAQKGSQVFIEISIHPLLANNPQRNQTIAEIIEAQNGSLSITTSPIGIENGKFHGAITAITPRGT